MKLLPSETAGSNAGFRSQHSERIRHSRTKIRSIVWSDKDAMGERVASARASYGAPSNNSGSGETVVLGAPLGGSIKGGLPMRDTYDNRRNAPTIWVFNRSYPTMILVALSKYLKNYRN